MGAVKPRPAAHAAQLGKGAKPPLHPPSGVSAVQQVGDERPIYRAGDARLQDAAHELPAGRVIGGGPEQGGAGDDLAAGTRLPECCAPGSRRSCATRPGSSRGEHGGFQRGPQGHHQAPHLSVKLDLMKIKQWFILRFLREEIIMANVPRILKMINGTPEPMRPGEEPHEYLARMKKSGKQRYHFHWFQKDSPEGKWYIPGQPSP
ncbi:MAG TPA: hypothetical protein VMF32_24640 [Xanthobacteraceae bacterium]|nr:hypothetical protein [Xanthobacteraceae bacterium]